MRVYVSGPYSSDVTAGTRVAMEAAHILMDMGHAPFCPHLSHFLDMQRHRPYEDWLKLDLAWVDVCDAVLRLPGKSSGADRECARAEKLGIPVYYDYGELNECTDRSI